jgi:hypothetical protein
MSIQKIIKEFEEMVSYPSENKMWSIDDEDKMKQYDDKHLYYSGAYPESIWELDENKIKSFLLQSHLNYLEEEVKRLEGEKRICPHDSHCHCREEKCYIHEEGGFNSAIKQQIDLKKREIEETKKLL